MTWRTIETAPKDGTPVLAYYADRPWRWAIVHWVPQYFDGAWWGAQDDEGPLFAPTHWMPLPEAPLTQMDVAA
jgi:hypothetical protein